MAIDYGIEQFETAVSIISSGPWTIQRRLRDAYESALTRVLKDEDIPEFLHKSFDSLMAEFDWLDGSVAEPDDDAALELQRKVAAFSASLGPFNPDQ